MNVRFSEIEVFKIDLSFFFNTISEFSLMQLEGIPQIIAEYNCIKTTCNYTIVQYTDFSSSNYKF